MPIITSEVKTGETQQVGDFEITPTTNLFRVQFPGYHGGIIWNRPKAVMVKNANGEEYILPVRDVTRLTIWSMLAGGILGAILIGLMYRNK